MKKCCRCPEILPDNYFYQCCEKCRAKHSEQVKKIFADRKEKGLCQRCGKEKAQEGLTKCKDCAEKDSLKARNTRKFYADNGLCHRCGKVKVFEGEKNCPDCLEYFKRRNEERGEYIRTHKRIEYRNRKSKGLCVRCGVEIGVGNTRCSRCTKRINHDAKMRSLKKIEGTGRIDRAERLAFGLCYICGRELDLEGKKLCSKCYSTNYFVNVGYHSENQPWKNENKLIFGKCKKNENLA